MSLHAIQIRMTLSAFDKSLTGVTGTSSTSPTFTSTAQIPAEATLGHMGLMEKQATQSG